MIWHEYLMIGDSQFLVCRGQEGCGALVKTDEWAHHTEHHIKVATAYGYIQPIGGTHA